MAEPDTRHRGPLLERESELAAIGGALGAAREGSGRLLLIEGPPGIGKSSLLEAAREHAEAAGFAVLGADCDELEASFPFGLAIQLLEPVLAMPGGRGNGQGNGNGTASLFEGPAGLAAVLFGGGDPGSAGSADDAAFARIHGLTWICSNLSARAPLLLCVDDAQWADAASLAWLRYLARRLDGMRLLLAVAARSGEQASSEKRLGSLHAAPDPLLLRPSALSKNAAATIVRASLGDVSEEVSRACHSASGGNPFFLRELLAELATLPTSELERQAGEIVPVSVSRAVSERLSRMPETAARLARALAVLGDPTRLGIAARVAEMDADEAAQAADTLSASGLTDPGLPLHFSHPLVRGSVSAAVPAGERSRLHSRAAATLAADGAAPERIATHLLACDPEGSDWAIEALRESARHAERDGDPAAATRYLERALVERPDDERRIKLLFELGQAQIEAGDPRSAGTFEEALRLDGDTDRVRTLRELGRSLAVFGRLEEAAGAFDRASAAAGDRRDLQLEIEAELASIQLTLRGAEGVAERLARHREGLHGRSGGERMLMAVAAFADAQANLPCGPSADLAAAALRDWHEHGLRSASLCFYEGVMTLMYADRYAEADEFVEEAIRDARARGSLTALANASWLRAWTQLRCGHLVEAESEAIGMQETMSEKGGATTPLMRGVLVEALLERGKLEEAERELGEEAEGDLPAVSLYNLLRFARGRWQMARGELETGLADVLEAGRLESEVGGISPAVFPWRVTAAAALATLGESDRARELASEAQELAREFGAPRALGIVLCASGRIEGGKAGLVQLREAVEVLDRSPAHLERARAQLELGSSLRRAGSRRQAREPLRKALDGASQCGALPLVERAREELVASGARPRRAALRGREALTPSELRVARLAATGRSNREIAQDLFITVRTVEGHLSRAYSKLDIPSRDQLQAALE